MDASAVAIACGLTLVRPSARALFRLSFHFGLFQFFMPIIGWGVGSYFGQFIHAYDHWVAFALLAFVGVMMIRESKIKEKELNPEAVSKDPTRGMSLVTLSIATSIDALAIGVSFAMLRQPILFPSTVIGVVTAALTLTGMLVGGRIGLSMGKWLTQKAQITGGIILILIGLKILVQSLT